MGSRAGGIGWTPAFRSLPLAGGLLAAVASLLVVGCAVAGEVRGDGAEAGERAGARSLNTSRSMHYWLALEAIKHGEGDEALHHLVHAEPLESPGGQRIAHAAVEQALRASDLHAAEDQVLRLLAGRSEPRVSLAQLHLRLGIYGLDAGDTEDALHHTRHLLATGPPSDRWLGAAFVMTALQEGRTDEARALLARALAERIDRDLGASPCARPTGRITFPAGEISVSVVVDEEWAAHHDERVEEAVSALFDEVAQAFAGTTLRVRIASLDRWRSPDSSGLDALARAAADAFDDRDRDALMIVLTGSGNHGAQDGYHSSSNHLSVVRHRALRHDRETLIVVHEIGHHIGLRHRTGTFMQASGFPLVPGWSACQLEAMGAQARP